MSVAKDGYRFHFSLRLAVGWIILVLVFAIGLSHYKNRALSGLATQATGLIQEINPEIQNQFQANFYFYYEDRFLPAIEKILKENSKLKKVQIISRTGILAFDSSDPPKSLSEVKPFSKKDEFLPRIQSGSREVSVRGFQVEVFVPTGQFGVLYSFEEKNIRIKVLGALVIGALCLLFLSWVIFRSKVTSIIQRIVSFSKEVLRKFVGLRLKFLVAIVFVNLVTAAIVFFSLSALQKKQQTEQIEKESILFSQFSTPQVMSDFSNYFYFYYSEKFLPGIRSIVSTNENLISIRIHSKKNKSVIFDSEKYFSDTPAASIAHYPKSDLSQEIEDELKGREFVFKKIDRNHGEYFSVINVYRGDSQEPLYFIEYIFSFQSLVKNIAAIREQILFDLIPSLSVGLLIAILFAQLLIGPIRRLVAALQKVSAGDYEVSIDLQRYDEVGELIGAFNSMTSELRKKKELRKFLSESTYRQIMDASDSPEGLRIKSLRVNATVLFSDIRNFVSHCDALDAEEVTEMLNDYFSEMVEIVQNHGGEVDKFIGDGMLAVFYSEVPPHSTAPVVTAIQAIQCALEMQDRLKGINQKRMEGQITAIEIGIGITHGELISGPIGSKDRKDFTIIGDVVNLANRIEKVSKLGKFTKIVFSDSVEKMVRGLLDYEEIQHDKIQGKEGHVPVYELIRIRDIQSLLSNLQSSDQKLRKESVELLGQSRNISAISAILDCLRDSHSEVRLQAILALGKLSEKNNEIVLNHLFGRLKEESSEKHISALISVVGRLCNDDRILKLSPYLDVPDDRIVANTIEALGQVKSQACIDLVFPKLSSVNNRIKANAAMTLFAAGRLEVVGLLKPMLMHSSPLMRSSSAFALGELTLIAQKDELISSWKTHPGGIKYFLGELQACVPMLVSLLKDEDVTVKKQAIIALGKIRDRSSVLPLIDNMNVNQDEGELIQEMMKALKSIGSHKLVRDVIDQLS